MKVVYLQDYISTSVFSVSRLITVDNYTLQMPVTLLHLYIKSIAT